MLAVDLQLLIKTLAMQLGEAWEEQANAKLPTPMAAARFTLWLLADTKQYAQQHSELIDKLLDLYRRTIHGSSPTLEEWKLIRNELDRASGNAATDAIRAVADYGEKAAVSDALRAMTATRIKDAALAAAAAAAWSRSNYATYTEANTPEDDEWSEREAQAGSIQARRLLLYLQLDQPPRDAIEASLQQAVLDDESLLPVYLDYLEEKSDPVAGWLKDLT